MFDLATVSVVVSTSATVALAVYAIVQTRLQKSAENRRRQEREEDAARAVDLALAVVNVEHMRLWSIARQWELGDLVAWAQNGRFDPDDVLPADWQVLTTNLARLGFVASMLATYALVQARDASLDARMLLEFVHTNRNDQARALAKKIKGTVTQAALLFEDALAHCPRATVQRGVDTDIPMKSNAAEQILSAIAAGRSPARAAMPKISTLPDQQAGDAH